jgi:hypothetical protein
MASVALLPSQPESGFTWVVYHVRSSGEEACVFNLIAKDWSRYGEYAIEEESSG